MAIIATETRPQITTIAFNAHPTEQDVLDFIKLNETLLGKDVRHCTVVDMRLMLEATPRQRKMVADYMKSHFATLKAWRAGTAFVASSSVVRGIVAAIMWLQRPPYPWKIVANVETGIRWCEEQLTTQASS